MALEFTNTLLENLEHLGSWGILTTDVDLKITGWNRWLEKHSGQKAEQVIGQSLLAVFPDLVVRSLDRYFRQAIDGQSGILSQRFHKYLLPLPPTVSHATVMHMQQTAKINPLLEGEQVVGTLTLIEDVTERVVTEQELRQQAQGLEDANRHKDEFLAMLAHELRNPLAPIRNGVQVLNHVMAENDEARQTTAMIERQVSHMSRLIDDLLDVSRIVRGKVRLRMRSCDLVSILHDVANDYRSILADNRVGLTVELPTTPCWIEGDGIRLAQVVSNLLHNANKFTNPGGQVVLKIEVFNQPSLAVITVADNGIGMSTETLDRVFESFTQAESSLERSKGGLGLGLSLVKGLTELHGGVVEAFSAGLGKGSTFKVSLPLKEARRATAKAPAVSEPIEPRVAKRVLVIEDNHDTALSLKMLLNHLGFEVEVAHTGPLGIELARRFAPQVVLCDLGLPGLDGFGVARQLRSEEFSRDTFLIAQSGYGQVEDVKKSLEAGFDLHLVKPMDFSELERLIRSAKRESSIA